MSSGLWRLGAAVVLFPSPSHLLTTRTRYVGQLGGVLLAHWEHEFADDTVKLINECPFGVVEVQFHSIVWAPKVGQLLSGTHSLSSPSHLSLLFSKTFNVSIPLNHIPQDKYEFEHTDEGADEDDMSSDDESDDGGLSTPSAVHEVGRWKDKSTGAILGSAGERVAFTVIGMQVTNNMLSLTGSLLADPSKAPAMPTVVASAVARSPSPDLPEPPAKRQATAKVAAPRATKAPAAARKSAAPPVPEVDTSNMNARELKKFRKEQDKLKRDARKARKGDAGGGDEEKEDADARDLEVSTGGKRKAEDQGGEPKKKRTD